MGHSSAKYTLDELRARLFCRNNLKTFCQLGASREYLMLYTYSEGLHRLSLSLSIQCVEVDPTFWGKSRLLRRKDAREKTDVKVNKNGEREREKKKRMEQKKKNLSLAHVPTMKDQELYPATI